MDRSAALPARPQLLHAAAGPGGSTAGHLHRVAAQRDARWVDAGTLFVLPGVVALLALSAVYVAFGTTAAVTAVFVGVAPAVLAIVVQAVLRVGRRASVTRC